MSKNNIKWTTQFNRDIKRQKRRKKNFSKLKELIKILRENKVIPQKYKPHKLSGNLKNHFGCHIEPDWLFIWKREKNDIFLVRTGTHSDIFK